MKELQLRVTRKLSILTLSPPSWLRPVTWRFKENISGLLQLFPVKTLWAKRLGKVEVPCSPGRMWRPAFCAFGLWTAPTATWSDTYDRQSAEIPAIIVLRSFVFATNIENYLAALNMRAFDFICHPYRKPDIERILRSAIDVHQGSEALSARISCSFRVRTEHFRAAARQLVASVNSPNPFPQSSPVGDSSLTSLT